MNLGALSDMITPAVLLSGCGTLILSTSNRLSRASDRVRALRERGRALANAPQGDAAALAEWDLIERLVPRLIRRVRLIHRSLVALYVAVELLVLTSLVIGAVGMLGWSVGIAPLVTGLAGVCAMSYAAALLIVEARLSLTSNLEEMEAIQRLVAGRKPG